MTYYLISDYDPLYNICKVLRHNCKGNSDLPTDPDILTDSDVPTNPDSDPDITEIVYSTKDRRKILLMGD